MNRQAWTLENWNAINVYETGWLNGEFEKAQANLRANVLAGCGGDGFGYTGRPGTSPLPIMLAHFSRSTRREQPGGLRAATIWTNSTFDGALDPFVPDPYGFAGNLYLVDQHGGVATGRQHAVLQQRDGAGLPVELLGAEPAARRTCRCRRNSANKPTNHLVILQVRRRLAAGLAAQVELHVAAAASRAVAPGLPPAAASTCGSTRHSACDPDDLDV